MYQIGLPPRRIAILTRISGVEYDEAIADAVTGHLGGQPVRCMGFDALLANKRASGRTQDLADVEALEQLRKARK